MKTISARLQDTEFTQLSKLSHGLNKSVNDIVREAIRTKLISYGLNVEEIKDPSEFKVIQLPRGDEDFKPFQTKYELKLLEALRTKGLTCQHNLKLFGFYPDIFLPDYNLVIEIDGAIHESKKRKKYDQKRTQVFNDKGIKVMRFTNREVEKTFGHCIRTVLAYVNKYSQTPNLLTLKRVGRA